MVEFDCSNFELSGLALIRRIYCEITQSLGAGFILRSPSS